MSLGETLVRPTAMLWRNMAAMAAEEMFRANPIDGARAARRLRQDDPGAADGGGVGRPSGGRAARRPDADRHLPRRALGCGTDVWRLSEEVRAGTLSERGLPAVRVVDDPQPRPLQHDGHGLDDGSGGRGAGHDAARARPGLPAPDSRLLGACPRDGPTGGRDGRRRPAAEHVMTTASFHNAIVALAAIGGSTNAVVHLLAIAGRLGIQLTLDDFDRIGAGVPLLVDLEPAGRYLMEDLHRAGGLLAVLREVRDLLDSDAMTVTGRPLVEYLETAEIWDATSSARAPRRSRQRRGIAVLRGNLAPDGRDHQARRRLARAAAASRPGGRVRLDRGLPGADRRPRPRRRRGLGAGPARLRSEGLPGHARGREPAAAEEAARAGRARHGPHLRRADERHRLRHGRAARRARGGASAGR